MNKQIATAAVRAQKPRAPHNGTKTKIVEMELAAEQLAKIIARAVRDGIAEAEADKTPAVSNVFSRHTEGAQCGQAIEKMAPPTCNQTVPTPVITTFDRLSTIDSVMCDIVNFTGKLCDALGLIYDGEPLCPPPAEVRANLTHQLDRMTAIRRNLKRLVDAQ